MTNLLSDASPPTPEEQTNQLERLLVAGALGQHIAVKTTVTACIALLRSQTKELEGLREEVQWMPIAERFPKPHVLVDVTMTTGKVALGSYMGPDIGWWVDDSVEEEDGLVAWRARPAPFKTSETFR